MGKKSKKNSKNNLSFLAIPFYFIGNIFKNMYDDITTTQEYMREEREKARKKEEEELEKAKKKEEQEIKENEKFFKDLEHTEIILDDTLYSCGDDIDRFYETETYKTYMPVYDKQMNDFVEKAKKKLTGDELRLYLLLCRKAEITAQDAAKYLCCDYNHAYYILNSLCDRLYISKFRRDNTIYYEQFDHRWLKEL